MIKFVNIIVFIIISIIFYYYITEYNRYPKFIKSDNE